MLTFYLARLDEWPGDVSSLPETSGCCRQSHIADSHSAFAAVQGRSGCSSTYHPYFWTGGTGMATARYGIDSSCKGCQSGASLFPRHALALTVNAFTATILTPLRPVTYATLQPLGLYSRFTACFSIIASFHRHPPHNAAADFPGYDGVSSLSEPSLLVNKRYPQPITLFGRSQLARSSDPHPRIISQRANIWRKYRSSGNTYQSDITTSFTPVIRPKSSSPFFSHRQILLSRYRSADPFRTVAGRTTPDARLNTAGGHPLRAWRIAHTG